MSTLNAIGSEICGVVVRGCGNRFDSCFFRASKSIICEVRGDWKRISYIIDFFFKKLNSQGAGSLYAVLVS